MVNWLPWLHNYSITVCPWNSSRGHDLFFLLLWSNRLFNTVLLSSILFILPCCVQLHRIEVIDFVICTRLKHWGFGTLRWLKNRILPQFYQCQAGILWRGLPWSLCTGWHSHSPWSYLVSGWVLGGCVLHTHGAEHAPSPHCRKTKGKYFKAGWSACINGQENNNPDIDMRNIGFCSRFSDKSHPWYLALTFIDI